MDTNIDRKALAAVCITSQNNATPPAPKATRAINIMMSKGFFKAFSPTRQALLLFLALSL